MANCYGVQGRRQGGVAKQYAGHAANVITTVIAVSLYVVSFPVVVVAAKVVNFNGQQDDEEGVGGGGGRTGTS